MNKDFLISRDNNFLPRSKYIVTISDPVYVIIIIFIRLQMIIYLICKRNKCYFLERSLILTKSQEGC